MNADALRELLAYDPLTGAFVWRRKINHAKPGDAAGHLNRTLGYVMIGVAGRCYWAHRLAWLHVTGEWPERGIDHINGVKHDNRWSNLREATQGVNNQNQRRAHRDSLTGVLGVTKKRRKYRAQIVLNRKTNYLGTFDTPELAHAAYLAAKRRMHEGGTI